MRDEIVGVRRSARLLFCLGWLCGGCAEEAPDAVVEPNATEPGTSELFLASTGLLSPPIAAGSSFACAILASGHVKCWGANDFGQLGAGHTVPLGDPMYDSLPFVNLGEGRTAKAITAGGASACAILDNNWTKCWGNNSDGQLGLGDTDTRGDDPGEMGDNLPVVDLGLGRTAKFIEAGTSHVCAVLDNGSVKCWGNNSSGQLGQDDVETRGDGALEMGNNLPPVNLGSGVQARAVVAEGVHSCAVLTNNTLKCWGQNEYSQLGKDYTRPWGIAPGDMAALTVVNLGASRSVKSGTVGILTATSEGTCVILDNNALKCWGRNDWDSFLGVGKTPDEDFKVGQPTCEISAPGPACDPSATSAQIALGTGVTAKAVAMGGGHTCAILNSNAIKCWGWNEVGRLGLDSTIARGETPANMGGNLPTVALGAGRTALAIALGFDFTCAALDNGKLKCWGGGANFRLADMGTSNIGDGQADDGSPLVEMGDNRLPALLGGRSVVGVVAGGGNTCTLFPQGDVTCWGSNLFGGLGLNLAMGTNLPNADTGLTVSLGATAKTLVTGAYHTCALLSSNQIKCWGSNSSGQLGTGNLTNLSAPPATTLNVGTGTVLAVGGGDAHTCVLRTSSGVVGVKCWGENANGQLGRGNTTDLSSPPSTNINLGTGVVVSKLAVGGVHACVIISNSSPANRVKCWGGNAFGQLGVGNLLDRGDTTSDMGDSLPFLNLGTGRTAKAIATGSQHTCALLDNDQVKCWGRNTTGQLGRGNTTNLSAPPSSNVDLGTGRTAKAIVAGGAHTCAVLDNNKLKCWGANDDGELGLGNFTHWGDGPSEMGNNLPYVDIDFDVGLVAAGVEAGFQMPSLTAGANHTCVRMNSKQLSCWGFNGSGQLGDGTTDGSPQPWILPVSLGFDP